MSSYIYTGKKTTVITPQEQKCEKLIDKASFIINASRPLRKKKSSGSVSFYKYKGSQLMDFQIDCIKRICRNPQIIFVTGADTNKMAKHKRRAEFCIVENKIHELANNAEDLRIGINAAMYDQTFWMDGRFVPTIKTFRSILVNPKSSSCLVYKRDNFDLGVVCNSNNIITSFLYKAPLKVRGLYYLNTVDTNRLKNKVSISFNHNMFDYDLLKEFGMTIVVDNSSSYFLEES
jgi:hypothetical protein